MRQALQQREQDTEPAGDEDARGDPSPGPRARPQLLGVISDWMKRRFGKPAEGASLKEALEEVLEEHSEEAAALDTEERTMLRNMISFGELTVSDIMVPRTDIIACPANATLEQFSRLVLEQGHTRMPVYEGTLDSIRGFVHIKDVLPILSGMAEFDLKKVIREILFVPPSMRVLDLLVKMRLSGVHMAIVVDEYGGTDGLVTMENLFEEIVGEIQDEHDDIVHPVSLLRPVTENSYEADARVRIETLEQELGVPLISEEEEDFDTLGGLIFFHTGRVPGRGEVIDHPSGVKFEIMEADPRRIRKVRITRLPHSRTMTEEPH